MHVSREWLLHLHARPSRQPKLQNNGKHTRQEGDDLDGLAKTHVVAQDAALLLLVQPPHPDKTFLLVVVESVMDAAVDEEARAELNDLTKGTVAVG